MPNSVSKEAISFLNEMLQYDSKLRVDSKELLNHPFLIKNVRDFNKINIQQRVKNKQQYNKSKIISSQERNNLEITPIPEESVEKKRIMLKILID